MEFHETVYGKRFFDRQLPDLIHALQGLTESVKQPQQRIPNLQPRPNLLRDFYSGHFQPGEEAGVEKTPRYKELAKEIARIGAELRSRLSAEDWALVNQYSQVLVDRCSEELDITFEAGYRTATQLMVAGLLTSQPTSNQENGYV